MTNETEENPYNVIEVQIDRAITRVEALIDKQPEVSEYHHLLCRLLEAKVEFLVRV